MVSITEITFYAYVQALNFVSSLASKFRDL